MPSVAASTMSAAVTPAAVESATSTVESASTVKAVAPTEPSVSVEPASTMEFAFTMKSAVPMELTTAPAIMIPVAAEAAPVVAPSVVTAPIVTVTVVAVIPGAGANEYPADEPIWAVVTVGRTSIGVIIIVAVSAYRRRAIVSRADANSDHHPLCMRERRAKKANSK